MVDHLQVFPRGTRGRIEAVCFRAERAESIRKPPVPSIELSVEHGVAGDVHAGPGDRQVALVRWEVLQSFRDDGLPVAAGDMGENVVFSGLEPSALAPGMVLALEGGAVLQLTAERTPCVDLEDIAPGLLKAAVGRCGYFARVVRPGLLRAGHAVTVVRPLER